LINNTGRKRRNSEDDEMGECSTTTTRRSSKTIKLSELKRQKTGLQKRSTRGALLGKIEGFPLFVHTKLLFVLYRYFG
jgi:hypothetical protein